MGQNLVQSVLNTLKLRGFTQDEIAERLGCTGKTISNLTTGRSRPSPKLMKALGIRRTHNYEVTGDGLLADVGWNAPKKQRYVRKKPFDPMQNIKGKNRRVSRPKLPYVQVDESSPMSEGAYAHREHGTLTLERIKVAQRHKVNPGQTWEAFKRETSPAPGNVEAAWEVYCRDTAFRIAQEAPPGPLEPPPAPVVAPEPARELYAHLKPVQRGIDHRRKPALGELPQLVVPEMPEAK